VGKAQLAHTDYKKTDPLAFCDARIQGRWHTFFPSRGQEKVDSIAEDMGHFGEPG
jgi:hypothetical protein